MACIVLGAISILEMQMAEMSAWALKGGDVGQCTLMFALLGEVKGAADDRVMG